MKIIILILILSVQIFAQNTDSLFNALLQLNSLDVKSQNSISFVENKNSDKCGFTLRASIKQHYDKFSIEQQQTIDQIFERPELEESIVSPSGIFRLHFTRTGINRPQYGQLNVDESVAELAVAFDSSYNFEVNILGYPAPPSDNSIGGDNKYDIYILHLGGGLYGATTPETTIGEGKYISYIEIDNSFNENEGYNTFGLDAARVTAAHEFHHAVQVGNYVYRDEDAFYYEITSTAFEEFVYDEVNDYYFYMNSYFRNTNNRFENNSGYNLAIWNIFLTEFYFDKDPMLGHNIVKRSWELMPNNKPLSAIAQALSSYENSFAEVFNTFGAWLVFTGDNAIEGEYFEEGKNYGTFKSTYTFPFDESQKSLTFESLPSSINFLTYTGFGDTIVTVISNSDISGSLTNGNETEIDFTISNGSFEGGSSINGLYYSNITSDNDNFIQASYIINNELSPVNISLEEIDYPFPQPFNSNIHDIVKFPTYQDISGMAELKILSSDLNEVYFGKLEVKTTDKIVVEWNGLDNRGSKLASGVYIYVTKGDGKIKKGKFAVLN